MPDSSSDHVILVPDDCAHQPTRELHSLVDARALAAGVHDLLGLLAASCGGSRREAAALLGRDPRTFGRKHEMPSLTFLADLARALRMEVATAVAVVVGAQRASLCAVPAFAALSAADFADDGAMLDELAECLREEQCCPLVVQIAQAACARAAQLRGESDLSLQLLRHLSWDKTLLEERGSRERTDVFQAIVANIAATVASELCLHYVLRDDHHNAQIACASTTRWLACACEATSASDDVASHVRRDAQQHVLEVTQALLLEPESQSHRRFIVPRVIRALQALDTLLDRCKSIDRCDISAACARIWAASFAGETACCALFSLGDCGDFARVAIRLVVRASFMLDEAVDLHCAESRLDAASRLACARRARLAEREALVRARCDKFSNTSNEITNFTQTLYRSLDALSSRDQMQGHVPCLRSGVAFADSRSESRC